MAVNSKYRVIQSYNDGSGWMVERGAIDLDLIQKEIIEWQTRNFGDGPPSHPLLGMVEEIGELCHSVLKREQGIRGTAEEHIANERDSIGDLFVYALAYCAKRGWKASDILEETWLHVQQRDWKKDPTRGVVG